jgi:diguanylate cyclase (GGDEF)-like protein
VVDDDEVVRDHLASLLKSASYEVDVADSGKAALRILRARSYDILLTDCQMPEMDGLTLCQQVRALFAESSPYIIMFTVKAGAEDRYAGFKVGADAYIIKGASTSELLSRVGLGRRKQADNHAPPRSGASNRRSLLRDSLTNVRNIKYFNERMPTEIAGARRRRRALSVLRCRIDGLEDITRIHGRTAADEALCAFADAARHYLRPGQDWVARLDEDRFMVVLPRTPFNGADRLARKIRRRLSAMPGIAAAGSIHWSIKIHVVCEPRSDSTLWSDRAGDPRDGHDAGSA